MGLENKDWLSQLQEPIPVASEPLSDWKSYGVMSPVPIDWVVENWLAGGDVTILASEGGLGKSWKAAHIAMKVANGEFVDGAFPVKQGNVLWYDNENGPYENQRRCWMLDRGIGFRETRFSDFNVYFQEKHWTADEEGIEAMRARVAEVNPILLVIDSLVSIFPSGMSENAATDVRVVMDRIMGVLRYDDTGKARERPIACLVLHHTKKESQSEVDAGGWPTYRGSTDFKNACSFMVMMRGKEIEHEDGTKETRVQSKWVKARRGELSKNIYEFSLKDHGEKNDPLHWVEYHSFGVAREFSEYLVDKFKEVVPVGAQFSRRDLIDAIKGFPENREKGKRWIEFLSEKKLVTQILEGKGNQPSIYARVGPKIDFENLRHKGSEN